MPRIFDNIEKHLLPALQETLLLSNRADFCVGYFNLRGWKKLDAHIQHWAQTDGVCRLLVGMQKLPETEIRDAMSFLAKGENMDNQTAVRLKKRLAQAFRRQLAFGAPNNEDEAGLRQLAHRLRERKVVVKLFLKHPLHAKLYLLFRQDPVNPIIGYLGSSNLTMAGLTGQGELNVDVLDHDATLKLAKWFEDRWDENFCIDITKELIEILEQSWAREQLLPPYHIYIKMAYHLAEEARAGLAEFQIPSEFKGVLFDFQEAAVRIAAHHVNKRKGVLIGDVVGLGKTLLATALARLFEDDFGMRTLIICPKNLESMWNDYRETYGLRGKVLSSSRILRDLADERRYQLVIIDESHNLRNREGKTFRAIQEYIRENDCRVILLSATPYNKSYLDLSSQLRLFVEEDLDIGVRPERYLRDMSETEFLARHQCSPRTLAAFEKSEFPDDWRDLMRLYLVRRTRSFILDNYAHTDPEDGRRYLAYPDGRKAKFPTRLPRTIRFKADENDAADAYARLYSDAVVNTINALNLPRYGLGNYIVSDPEHPPTNDEKKHLQDLSRAGKRLMGFCRTNLFKRLESSGMAFILSVERHVLRNYIFLHAIENDLPLPIGAQGAEYLDTRLTDEDADRNRAELFGNDNEASDSSGAETGTGQRRYTEADFRRQAAEVYTVYASKYHSRFNWLKPALFQSTLAENLKSDAEALRCILETNGCWDPTVDQKLAALEKLIRIDHANQKLLIFSQFADTVRYLDTQLRARGCQEHAAVSGSSANPTEIAWRFSPESNNKRDRVPPNREIRVLLATDILSEGQNLQDCHIIVNYDLPWAIIRLIQRAGRVDRIGQHATEIPCYSFFIADGVEKIIRLRSRVRQRLLENAEVVGSDEAFFEDEDDAQTVRNLYTEHSGILDDDDDAEVDLASQAYQIWKNAIERDPALRPLIENMPDVVYSTKAWLGCGADSGAGVSPAVPTEAGQRPAPQNRDDQSIADASEPALTQGACIMRAPDIAGIVRDAICHFNDQRYHLHAWCIMPNHVHAVVTPWGEHTLSAILHSWKSYAAHLINRHLKKRGEVWERESFDHLIRSSESLSRFIAYVERNPVEAGLCSEPEQWGFSSCGAGIPPGNSREAAETAAPLAAPPPFHPPGEIDYSNMKSRGELPHLRKDGATYFVTFRLRDAILIRGAGVSPAVPTEAGQRPAPLDRPEGVLVYTRTATGTDALAYVNKAGESITESQIEILRAAACNPDTPAQPRNDLHHQLVRRGVEHIVSEEKRLGGQLGSPRGARFRTYERLKHYVQDLEGTLFAASAAEITQALEEIYKNPLRPVATDTLNRQLKSGISDDQLAELVLILRKEGRLCIIHEDETPAEPHIICSMGLFGKDEG